MGVSLSTSGRRRWQSIARVWSSGRVIDSATLLDIIASVHEQTEVEIPDRDCSRLSTFGDAVACLAVEMSRCAQRSSPSAVAGSGVSTLRSA